MHHATVYRYREPVQLGEHRMMFRPRESHDLRLIRTSLTITPRPVDLRWLHDPFDNSVAVATFEGSTSDLRFESSVTLEHFEYSPPEYALEAYARTYPFRYSDEDFPNLERALAPHCRSARVSEWALQFLDSSTHTDTLKILRAMTLGIREQFVYVRRLEKGVQTPEETLARGQGTCRDFAVLSMEAARSLGIAARFVSGYVFGPMRPPPTVPRPMVRRRGRRGHARVDAGLSAGGRLGGLRPHQQHHRQPQSHPRGRGVGARARAAVVGHIRGARQRLPRDGRHRDRRRGDIRVTRASGRQPTMTANGERRHGTSTAKPARCSRRISSASGTYMSSSAHDS